MNLDDNTEDSRLASTIFEAVKQCVERIEVYVASDRPQSRKYANNMREKLEVWAKYSGATSRQGLSLDDRLNALPGVKNAVLGLLQMIIIKAKQAIKLPDDEIDISDDDPRASGYNQDNSEALPVSKSFEKSSTSYPSDRVIARQGTLWRAITKAIDSLFKLTAAIRESDASNRDAEVPSHYSRPDDLYFEDMAKLFVRRWFPHARKDLCDQLGHAVHTRRRKILYQQRHEEKLQFQRPSTAVDSVGMKTSALPEQLSTSLNIATIRQPEDFAAEKWDHRLAAPSLTQFSQFQTQSVIMRRARAATVITSRTKGSVVPESAEIDYPDPPTDSDHNAVLFCPYCCKQLTQSQLRNWRRHVDADLKPFVCISESCQSPPRLFAFQSDWLQHMAEYHGNDWHQTIHMTTWFCDIDHEEQQEFVNLDEFQKHLASHKLSIPNQNVLIRHNQALGSRAPGVCPLCEDIPKQETDVGARALFDHIANHLRRIALMALPTMDVQGEMEGNNTGSVQSEIAMAPDSSSGLLDSISRSDYMDSGLASPGFNSYEPQRVPHSDILPPRIRPLSDFPFSEQLPSISSLDLPTSHVDMWTSRRIPRSREQQLPLPPFSSLDLGNFSSDVPHSDTNSIPESFNSLKTHPGHYQEEQTLLTGDNSSKAHDNLTWFKSAQLKTEARRIAKLYRGYHTHLGRPEVFAPTEPRLSLANEQRGSRINKDSHSEESESFTEQLEAKLASDNWLLRDGSGHRFLESEDKAKDRFQCTLGCSWSDWKLADWENHELVHYPQRIWICYHPDCLYLSHVARVSPLKHLARRHYVNLHQQEGDPELTEEQLDHISELVPDSMYPKECVFQDCNKTFDSFDHRSRHVSFHLLSGSTLCREKIIKYYVDEPKSDKDYTYMLDTIDHSVLMDDTLGATAYLTLPLSRFMQPKQLLYEDIMIRNNNLDRVPDAQSLEFLLKGLQRRQKMVNDQENLYGSALQELAIRRGTVMVAEQERKEREYEQQLFTSYIDQREIM